MNFEDMESFKKDKKYRWLLVDNQEGFTIVIQYKNFIGRWITIKTIEDEDYEYLKICAEDIVDMLSMEP